MREVPVRPATREHHTIKDRYCPGRPGERNPLYKPGAHWILGTPGLVKTCVGTRPSPVPDGNRGSLQASASHELRQVTRIMDAASEKEAACATHAEPEIGRASCRERV